jgi:sporulation-control protein spo0M
MIKEIKDSEGKTYGANVLDDLVKTYNFMVKYKFNINNVTQVYRANVQAFGYHPSTAYCNKFVKEIKYIAELSENQPKTVVEYTRRMVGENGVWVNIGGVETDEIKTFDKNLMRSFIAEWEYKPKKDNTYIIKNIIKTDEINLVEQK